MHMKHLPAPPERETEWLTLSQAAHRLGVHPTTLRRWADKGEIRCMRTPGGHRRFREEDVRTFLKARRQPHLPQVSEAFFHDLIRHTRREMSAEHVEAQPWHAAFDDAGRAARRESGRRLLGLALQYTMRTTGRGAIVEEGRRIGWKYGQDAAERGLSIADTVRALIFFRETLIRSVRPGLSTQGQYDAEDVHIHRSMRAFLDHVLFAAMDGYERAWRPSLPNGAAA